MRPVWEKYIFQKMNISAITFEIEIAKKLMKACEYAPRIILFMLSFNIQIIKAKKFSILRYTMQVYVTYTFRKFIFENSL